MTNLPPEDDLTPLGDVLENLPPETPPSGLKDRVLRAVHDEESAMQPKRKPLWPLLLRTAGAVAAVFVVMVMVSHLTLGKKAVTASMQHGSYMAVPPGAPAAAKAGRDMMGPSVPAGAPPGAPAGAPASPPPAGYYGDHTSEYGGGSSWQPGGGRGPVQQPWRDMSGQRQKVTHQEMELQVKKVEDAYDRATNIIRKEGGYIENEDLSIADHGPGRAHLQARVPVDRLAAAISQLRELGKVVRLSGESEDVTDEYYGRGENIRRLGASEDELVRKYEAETDKARKAQLYRQIQALRAHNSNQKRPLQQLSKQTHFALLDLTLTEPAGPGKFLGSLGDSAATAAGWLAVSAIFWLPLLIIGLVIYRRKTSA